MQIENEAEFRRFIDTIKVNLLVWRRTGDLSLEDIAEKFGTSVRTVRRRSNSPETMTLGELFAWCELYGKDPEELLKQASRATKHEEPTFPEEVREPYLRPQNDEE